MSDTCPNCLNLVAEDARFCSNCGRDMQAGSSAWHCPLCSRAYEDGSRFCIYDGTGLTNASQPVPTCPACNTIYGHDVKYCLKDGTALEAVVHTPDAVFANFYYKYPKASLGRRLAASLIDTLLVTLMTIPACYCLFSGLRRPYSDDASTWYLLAAVFYFVPLIYGLIKDGLGRGQSPGKRALDIMVVDLNDNWHCDKSRSALRNLVATGMSIVPYILYFKTQSPLAALLLLAVALIDPVMVLARGDGRKLGDLAANTQVIDIKNYRRYDMP